MYSLIKKAVGQPIHQVNQPVRLEQNEFYIYFQPTDEGEKFVNYDFQTESEADDDAVDAEKETAKNAVKPEQCFTVYKEDIINFLKPHDGLFRKKLQNA